MTESERIQESLQRWRDRAARCCPCAGTEIAQDMVTKLERQLAAAIERERAAAGERA